MSVGKTLIVVGAGASGCMAAIAAARENPKLRVVLIDGNDQIGRKILATGNGRCNYTNERQHSSCYHSDDPDGMWVVYQQFPVEETIGFFESLGILPVERNGYVYPMSNQAASVRRALELELQRLEVTLKLNCRVKGIACAEQGFVVTTSEGELRADACILTTGGKAAPNTGSDGSGFSFGERLGHTLIRPYPSLVPLGCIKHPFKEAAGVRVQARVSTKTMDGKDCSDVGELQITKQGISGIPVFQISGAVAEALAMGNKPMVSIDFLPTMERSAFHGFVEGRLALGYTKPEEVFFGCLPKALIDCVFSGDAPTSVDGYWQALHEITVGISQTMGFGAAQTTGGGISMKEISCETMESRIHQGLYFAGEVLHVDGICGGYNLQWAWSSGYVAGSHAAKELL